MNYLIFVKKVRDWEPFKNVGIFFKSYGLWAELKHICQDQFPKNQFR